MFLNAAHLLFGIAVLTNRRFVDAFSGGAGTCVVDEDGPVFPQQAPHFGFKTGPLGSGSSGPYQVDLDGRVLSEVTDEVVYVRSGEDVTVNIASTPNMNKFFKGFLVTLQADGMDLSDSLSKQSSEVQILENGETEASIGLPAECDPAVSGATHTNPSLKANILDDIVLNIPVGNLGVVKLGVTVMTNRNEYYFSSYNLDVLPPSPPEPSYVRIQGKSTDSGTTLCWKVRGGQIRVANKIILAECKENDDAQLFALEPISLGVPIGLAWVQIHPKLDPEKVVIGVREPGNKAWLRIEEPGGRQDTLTTQIFTTGPPGPPKESYKVRLGFDPSCGAGSENDTCLYVTQQGLNTDEKDPVMLRTGKELMRFKKHGDIIEEWSFV